MESLSDVVPHSVGTALVIPTAPVLSFSLLFLPGTPRCLADQRMASTCRAIGDKGPRHYRVLWGAPLVSSSAGVWAFVVSGGFHLRGVAFFCSCLGPWRPAGFSRGTGAPDGCSRGLGLGGFPPWRRVSRWGVIDKRPLSEGCCCERRQGAASRRMYPSNPYLLRSAGWRPTSGRSGRWGFVEMDSFRPLGRGEKKRAGPRGPCP